MTMDFFINLVYILSCVLFAFGLKMLGSPVSARRGNLLSAGGMLLAVAATLFSRNIITFQWILIGIVLGSVFGILVALRAAMTQMPEMVALLHGCGGLASVFVDWSAYHVKPVSDMVTTVALYLSILIGGITFTGSLIAWGKLSEKLPGKSILFPGQRCMNMMVLGGVLILGGLFLQTRRIIRFF